MEATTTSMMDLPVEMIDKILSYLSYDQIAKLRPINLTFNNICSDRLNNGFVALEKFHSKCMKAVKSKLPRRESERKHHPLSRHCDILMAVETRFSMLSMTFTKYIEMRQCCFIPGKVLDEAFRVLRIVNNSSSPSTTSQQYQNLPRPYEFLQEYRDISSMAMEHFDDKILPTIREKMRSENPQQYCYKNKLSRPQLCMRGLKTNSLKLLSDLGKASNSSQGEDNHLYKVSHPAPGLKLAKVLHSTIDKCNNVRKGIGVLHRNMIIETNKLRIENIMLKRRCHQLKSTTKLMKKDLIETKNMVSAMAEDLKTMKSQMAKNHKKINSQRVSKNEVNSKRDEVTNPSTKLSRKVNVKYISASKKVDSLHRIIRSMAKRIQSQEVFLRRKSPNNVSSTQKLSNCSKVPSMILNEQKDPSCSRGLKRTSEEIESST